MFENRKDGGVRRILAVAVAVGLLCSPALWAADAEDTFESLITRITAFANLKVIERAVTTLGAGGAEADRIKEDPQLYLAANGLDADPEDLVLLINMDANQALTPDPDGPASSPEGFRLSSVAYVLTGPHRGIVVQRKLPSDSPSQSFEEAATELTLFVGGAVDYLAEIVHAINGLDEAEDAERLEFLHVAPADFIVEFAVEQKTLGERIGFSFLNDAHFTSFDIGRIEDPATQRFVPSEDLASAGEVVIGIGYVSPEWSLFVELTRVALGE